MVLEIVCIRLFFGHRFLNLIMKKILVPTDFSATANNAVKYAIHLAKKTNSDILFFHSVYSLVADEKLANSYAKEYAKIKLKAENKIRKEVENIYKKLHLKCKSEKVSFLVKFGAYPIQDIFDIVSEKKIDFIIIGTHGATGLKKVLFGSNTSQVISKANVPVLAIPLHHSFHPIQEIIYSTDLENVKNELKKLKPISKQLKVKITSVHFDYGWAKDKKEIKNIKILEGSMTNFHTQQVSLETPLLTPLKNYMKKRTYAVLCMFHASKKGIPRLLLGSNTERLSMGLKMPLLSIQKDISKLKNKK